MTIPGSEEDQKAWVDLLVRASRLLDGEGNLADGHSETEAKLMLTILLDHKYPDWRQNPRLKKVIVERVGVVGVVPAMVTMINEGLAPW